MSQSHFNYMNGVPVKIAETFKPPKKLALSQSVSQRLSTASNVTAQLLENSNCDCTLEQTVLSKMSEWQHIRQHEKEDRKLRLRQYQQERQSLFDAKQKQMITAVSYPSTDDLSSDDDGDDSGHGTSSDASKSAVSMKTVSIPSAQSKGPQQQFSPPNYFNNILVPTVMPGQEKMAPFKQINCTTVKTPHSMKFNYKEFENDTSSPFDSVELKTINDLDILAEVWNRSVAINNTTGSGEKTETPTNQEISNENQQNNAPNQGYVNQQVNSNTYNQGSSITQQNQTNCKQMNHSGISVSNSTIPTTSTITTNSYYGNQVHYNHNIDPNQSSYSLAKQAYVNNNPSYIMAQNPYVPSNYSSPIYNDQTVAALAMANIKTDSAASMYGDKTVINATTNCSQAKSKSVPDIVQEINVELQNSQGKRVRKISQSKFHSDEHFYNEASSCYRTYI